MPCLAVEIREPLPAYERIAAAIAGTMRRGVQAIWLRSAPWGNYEADPLLQRLIADVRWPDMPLLAVRPISSNLWLASDIAWIVDGSEFLSEPCTGEDLRLKIMTLDYRPAVAELVVRDPDPINCRAALLDALYEELAPIGKAWLYVENPVEFESAVRDTATPWGVRRA